MLLDVLMPGMDGYETCRRIRALPEGGDVPVLFLTALGDSETHKAALESGADDFLTKPLNRTELLIRVRSLLRIKRLSDELRANVQVIRTQRDALLAAQRQKDELTALIVHDLKNPLSSILSNVQYVQSRAALPVDERESLEDVLRASQSMVRLVMNLLDVSRSDDGALIPHVSAFELPELLGEICSEMGRRIEDKGQRLELSLAPGVGLLRGDRDLVRRIVENLIDNAYKYGPETGDYLRRGAAGDDGRRGRAGRRNQGARRGGRDSRGLPPDCVREVRAGRRLRAARGALQPRARAGVLPAGGDGARRRHLDRRPGHAAAAASAFAFRSRGCRSARRPPSPAFAAERSGLASR